MTSIIPYEPQYHDAVVALCLEALGCLSAGEETQQFTRLLKCDYYLEHDPQHCYVAVDGANGPVGCLLCASDFDECERVFNEAYLPKAAALSVKRYVDAKLGLLPYAMFRSLCRAHCAVYVQSAWSGQGIGGALLDALLQQLREEGADGVVTLTEPDRSDEIAFLEEKGFRSVLTTKFGHAMTCSFGEQNKII